MKQQIDTQIKSIVKEMQESILASVQAILDESLGRLRAATLANTNGNIVSHTNTVTHQGQSSPYKAASGPSSVEQSSVTGAVDQ
eukprot:15366462-Ditylum_brightwellii.AAC.2